MATPQSKITSPQTAADRFNNTLKMVHDRHHAFLSTRSRDDADHVIASFALLIGQLCPEGKSAAALIDALERRLLAQLS